MKQKDQLKQPFFAKLLESQKAMPAQGQGLNVYPPLTVKFFDDFDHTLKYPSDGDEDGTSI